VTTSNKISSNANSNKRRGLTVVSIAYLSAMIAAWVSIGFAPVDDLLLRTLVANLVATVVIFGWSLAYDNSSFYDAYWSLGPIAIVAYWVGTPEANAPSLRTFVVLAVVIAWGLRLTFNWARGWTGLAHEDWRYHDYRRKLAGSYWPFSFAGLHVIPTLIVFAGLAALFPALIGEARAANLIDLVALGLALTGLWFEWQADRQLKTFVEQHRESGATLRSGLWRYSRHPNYFGEILIWWSLFLFGMAANSDTLRWALWAPMAITAMILFVSIPLLEKRSIERRSGYQRVIDETSMLIPLPPRPRAAADREH
jgi:steroid 5-alpha reductase family enzyme